MSWNGTVNCRWCYGKGHNKRSCPEYTEVLKGRALQEINDGEGYNGYWGAQYNKRVKKTGLYADGTPMSKEAIQAATKSSKRRCKYCGAQGHNKRTCQELKHDKGEWIAKELDWRKKIKAWAEEVGYGTGALLKVDRWGEVYAWMVTDIKWNDIASNDVGRGVVWVQSCRSNQRDNLSLPRIPEINEEAWTRTVLLSGVPKAVFPENFLKAEGCKGPVERHFDDDAKSSKYWDNYYN